MLSINRYKNKQNSIINKQYILYQYTYMESIYSVGWKMWNIIKRSNNNNEMTLQKAQQNVLDRLKKQILACSYLQENVNIVMIRSEELVNAYQLESGILSFQEDQNSQIIHLLEFSGKIKIVYKEKEYGVAMKLYLPQQFPKDSPKIRIINPDPNKFICHNQYTKYQSNVDGNSYIIHDLKVIMEWTETNTIIEIIKQLEGKLSTKFPFRSKPKQQDIKQGNLNVMVEQKTVVLPLPKEPKLEDQKIRALLVKQPRTPNQLVAYNEIENYVKRCREHIESSERMIKFLKHNYGETFKKIQGFDTLNKIVMNENGVLESEIKKLEKYVIQNQQANFKINVKELIVPYDQIHSELLDLVSEKMALDESAQLLESMFMEEKVDLQTFLKQLKRIQEERFTCKYAIRIVLNKINNNK